MISKRWTVSLCIIILLFACRQSQSQFTNEGQKNNLIDSVANTLNRKSYSDSELSYPIFLKSLVDTTIGFKPMDSTRHVEDSAVQIEYKTNFILRPYEIQINTVITDPYTGFVFLCPVSFRDCEFANDTGKGKRSTLNDCTFYSPVLFRGCIYEIPLEFESDIFKDRLEFLSSIHHVPLNDDRTLYNKGNLKSPTFQNCTFRKGVSFYYGYEGCTFFEDLNFENCRISTMLDLSYCVFDSSKLVLTQTYLPDTLDLSNALLSQTINLNDALPPYSGNKCEINLLNTDIDKIQFQYQNFHLIIPDSIKKNSVSSDLINHTYEGLLTNFKKNSYEISYQKLDIEYKDWQSDHDFGMWISGWWWKYGYEKWRIIIWTIVVLLVFSLLNALVYDKLFATYTIPQLDKTAYEYSRFTLIKYLEKYWLSIMYTGFIFFKLSIDFDKLKIQLWSILFLIFFEYAIGLLCTGYLLNWVLSK